MNQIVESLLSDNRWVNKNTIENLQSRHISIKEAFSGFSKAADTLDIPAYITIDGVVYEVKIELFNSMNTGGFMKSFGKNSALSEYGVTLDPDEFYPNETDEEITITISKSDGSRQTLTLKNPDYEGEINFGDDGIEVPEGSEFLDPRTQFNLNALAVVEYPVFLITLDENNGMGKTAMEPSLNKTASNYNYLAIKYIRIYRKYDSSAEEFQYFFIPNGNPNPQYHNVGPMGKFECDNQPKTSPHIDPIPTGITARWATFTVPNTSGKTYSPSLALMRLENGAYTGVSFIESDYLGLKLYKGGTRAGTYDIYKKKQYYKWLPNNTSGWHYQKYLTYGPAPDNNDDFYMGELLGVNANSVELALNANGEFPLPLYANGLGHLYTDLSVRFEKITAPY